VTGEERKNPFQKLAKLKALSNRDNTTYSRIGCGSNFAIFP